MPETSPPPPPFDWPRWCFWLLAVIILVMVGEAVFALFGCVALAVLHREDMGSCVNTGVVEQARESLELALTTVLALILAARRPPPD